MEGATRLVPLSSKHSIKAPFSLEILKIFYSLMDHNNQCDAVIFACIVCTFFCIAHLGEFTVPAISKFDPMKHITRAGLSFMQNHQSLPVIKFALPTVQAKTCWKRTKCC